VDEGADRWIHASGVGQYLRRCVLRVRARARVRARVTARVRVRAKS
jgi:hypothetical protein